MEDMMEASNGKNEAEKQTATLATCVLLGDVGQNLALLKSNFMSHGHNFDIKGFVSGPDFIRKADVVVVAVSSR